MSIVQFCERKCGIIASMKSEMKIETPLAWLSSKRRSRSVKVLCGVRGVGKTRALADWRDRLIGEGFPEDRIVCVNVEDPTLRRLVTADDVMQYLSTQFPPSGPVVLLLDEPTSFHDYEYVLEQLLGQRRVDIYLTLSSRRLANEGLSDYLRGALAFYEIMPPPKGIVEPLEASRARWNEILLRDVLSAHGVADGNIAAPPRTRAGLSSGASIRASTCPRKTLASSFVPCNCSQN